MRSLASQWLAALHHHKYNWEDKDFLDKVIYPGVASGIKGLESMIKWAESCVVQSLCLLIWKRNSCRIILYLIGDILYDFPVILYDDDYYDKYFQSFLTTKKIYNVPETWQTSEEA